MAVRDGLIRVAAEFASARLLKTAALAHYSDSKAVLRVRPAAVSVR